MPKPQALIELERVAIKALGRMDTLTRAHTLQEAHEAAARVGITNPIIVAFATSDRYYYPKWQEEHPEGKPLWLTLKVDPEWQDTEWKVLSEELSEDQRVTPEVFVVDGDRYAFQPCYWTGSGCP